MSLPFVTEYLFFFLCSLPLNSQILLVCRLVSSCAPSPCHKSIDDGIHCSFCISYHSLSKNVLFSSNENNVCPVSKCLTCPFFVVSSRNSPNSAFLCKIHNSVCRFVYCSVRIGQMLKVQVFAARSLLLWVYVAPSLKCLGSFPLPRLLFETRSSIRPMTKNLSLFVSRSAAICDLAVST